jgi:hypothetical protein
VCERSIRNDLNHAVQPRMGRYRTSFRSQMQFWPCKDDHEQYNSELKKEIPADAPFRPSMRKPISTTTSTN